MNVELFRWLVLFLIGFEAIFRVMAGALNLSKEERYDIIDVVLGTFILILVVFIWTG